jgi:hypothetical protein
MEKQPRRDITRDLCSIINDNMASLPQVSGEIEGRTLLMHLPEFGYASKTLEGSRNLRRSDSYRIIFDTSITGENGTTTINGDMVTLICDSARIVPRDRFNNAELSAHANYRVVPDEVAAVLHEKVLEYHRLSKPQQTSKSSGALYRAGEIAYQAGARLGRLFSHQ